MRMRDTEATMAETIARMVGERLVRCDQIAVAGLDSGARSA